MKKILMATFLVRKYLFSIVVWHLGCTPVFYEVCRSAWVSRELPPLYLLSIFSNYKHPPPPCNKTVGLAGLRMDFQSVKWISRAGGSPRAILPPSTPISAPTYRQHHNTHPTSVIKLSEEKTSIGERNKSTLRTPLQLS